MPRRKNWRVAMARRGRSTRGETVDLVDGGIALSTCPSSVMEEGPTQPCTETCPSSGMEEGPTHPCTETCTEPCTETCTKPCTETCTETCTDHDVEHCQEYPSIMQKCSENDHVNCMQASFSECADDNDLNAQTTECEPWSKTFSQMATISINSFLIFKG